MQRDCATLYGAERPRDATACRETARCHVVQRDRATLRGAEGPRDVTHVVQRDRATLQSVDKPGVATACRETARCLVVQRDRATLRGAEEPRDVTSCRGSARRYSVQRKIVQIEVVMRPRRRSIDHRAFWTGVGANRTRPAHPAGHSTPANPLSLGAYGENRFLAFHVKYQLSCQTFQYERQTDSHKSLSSTALD